MVQSRLLRHRVPVSGRLSRVRAALFLIFALAVGCGRGNAADPFAPSGPDGGAGEGGGGAGAGGQDSGPPPLAGAEPCVDQSQCDDHIDCTADSCDQKLGRCVHAPDDSACDDGVYCDGVETCSATLGCQAGPVVTMSLGSVVNPLTFARDVH